jgi:hypothetical protein
MSGAVICRPPTTLNRAINLWNVNDTNPHIISGSQLLLQPIHVLTTL